jgi:hypothetical protein
MDRALTKPTPPISARSRLKDGAEDRRWRAAVQLAALSVFPTISLVAHSWGYRPSGASLLLISAAWWTLALAGAAVLARVWGLSRALAAVSMVTLGFFGWGALVWAYGRTGSMPAGQHWFAGLVVAGVLLTGYRWGEVDGFRRFMYVGSLSILIVPGIQVISLSVKSSAAPLRVPSDTEVGGPAHVGLPDVYFVVVDGYGRQDVLAERYGFRNDRLIDALESEGFFVARRAWANYSMTHAAIPSMLAMDYVLTPGQPIGSKERLALYDVIGGDNPVVEHFRSAGYRYVHIENDWAGSNCRETVDRCVPRHFLDESVWALLAKTPLEPALRHRIGHPHSQSSMQVLDHLLEEARQTERNESPKFVYAHVLSPHPPLYLDHRCSLRVEPGLGGMNLTAPWDPEQSRARRRAAYIDQVECVNQRILQFVEQLGPDTVVLITADHGADSGGQLFKPLTQWTREDVWERLAIFSAYRLPARCEPAQDISSVNAFRLILGCLFEGDLPHVASRHFLVPVPEVEGEGQVLEVVLQEP